MVEKVEFLPKSGERLSDPNYSTQIVPTQPAIKQIRAKGEMIMLSGEYAHSIDPKGRVNFPAKLREELGIQFVVTRGLDNCLFVYSLDEWKVLSDTISALPISKARDFQRFFFSGAVQVEPDKQGRILLPTPLREHAKLTKDAVIIGAMNRAEIWDKERWDDTCGNMDSDKIALAMDEAGV